MCVAIVIPDDDITLPTLGELKEMEESNPHGAGVAWTDGGRVRWMKGLDATVVSALVRSMPRPMLVHFRWASAGGQGRGLCHPFPVRGCAGGTRMNGEADEVMVHNGHWGGWTECMKSLTAGGWKFPKGAWSDTRLVAHLLASDEGGNERDEILATVGGRVALLSGDGAWSAHGHWETVGGVHYSNTYWKGPRYTARRSSSTPRTGPYHGVTDWWESYSTPPQGHSLPSLAQGGGVPATDWNRARDRRGHSAYWGPQATVIDVDSEE